MPSPIVSVVMPTYNHARFLSEAIRSVLDQTFQDFELIVIDNFSTDETCSIIQSFDDDRIRYYKYSNQGVIAASRNNGIGQAQGRYVAFIDSDDQWVPDKLQRQIDFMEKDVSLVLTCGAFETVNQEGMKIGKVIGANTHGVSGYCYKKLLNANFIVSSSVMVRKEMLDTVGGFDEAENLICAEDYDLWLRLARLNPISHVNATVGTYRVHDKNASSPALSLQRIFNVLDKHLAQQWVNRYDYAGAKANAYFRAGWNEMASNVRQARKYYWQTLRVGIMHPFLFVSALLSLGCALFPGVMSHWQHHKKVQTWMNKFLFGWHVERKS